MDNAYKALSELAGRDFWEWMQDNSSRQLIIGDFERTRLIKLNKNEIQISGITGTFQARIDLRYR